MGYRAYVAVEPFASDKDSCLGKLYGYVDINKVTGSLGYLVDAMRNTPDNLHFLRYSGLCTIDAILDLPAGETILNSLSNWFDSSYPLVVRMSKIPFCCFLKVYHYEQCTLRYNTPPCTSLLDVLQFYKLPVNLVNYDYFYIYFI